MAFKGSEKPGHFIIKFNTKDFTIYIYATIINLHIVIFEGKITSFCGFIVHLTLRTKIEVVDLSLKSTVSQYILIVELT